jgi:uncharacterized protein YuzE
MADITIHKSLVEQIIAVSRATDNRQMWTDYDTEADVLYISFRKPQQANDSIMEADGNIYHYRDDELVGVTVPNASR